MRKQKLIRLLLTAIWFFVLINMAFFTGVARSEYPERAITIIVGFDPGGTIDLLTRAIAIGVSSYLKQPVVVENKAGGGGTVALGVVATAKPDGYTLCTIQNASIVDTSLMQKVPFKPLKSFTPITVFACSEHSGLLVNNDAPWRTFKEFIDYAKQNPGKIKYATSGVGTGMHVAMEVVARQEGIKWVHVPYKTSVTARTAVMGKHLDAVSSGTDWPPFVQSGHLRVLATHGGTRSPHFPDIPTFKELGYNFVSDTLHCVVGPAGLPPEVGEKLETAFRKGMETPEFKATMEKIYMSPAYLNSKEYGRSLQERWARLEKMFKEIGIIKEAATEPY
jgi:tripartite-type tricarboxylate transporter receptor subunit TctC